MVNLSISQVTRVLSKAKMYNKEKARRKEENYKRHNEQTKAIMQKKRYKRKMEEKAVMDKLHNQASVELSYWHTISNVDLRKNCSSAYEYNSKKKQFELKNDCLYSVDMLTKIKY